MAGYSETPLAKKLGIKDDSIVLMMNAPKDYPLKGVSLAKKGPADIVHLFVTSLAEFEKLLPQARKAMKIDGAIWVSWFKKAARIPTDVTENEIRDRALKTDLVDVKICAVDEKWSGLKLVVRKALR
jgi:hypothetical protein